MKFPIDVIQIEDRIVLIQGNISDEFKKQLRFFNNANIINLRIESQSFPQLRSNAIFLNGDSKERNYGFPSMKFDEDIFRNFKKTIERYKQAMSYE